MQKFTATIGAYVRAYATFRFTAKNLKEAPAAAIATYKKDGDDIMYDETDWGNVAMPSIVSIERVRDGKLVIEGNDFALNEEDARDWHAHELLDIVRLAAASDADIDSIRKRAVNVLAKIEAACRN